ncbi:hypothetical protein [Paenibacillus gorillae]|uniref:hypothetical protein n=1 Tax=Paenibacillus gorillae TaxID=1243662 RepID=UPI0004B3503C|nr:hypothetical protein [Paenibacillus gorillae]
MRKILSKRRDSQAAALTQQTLEKAMANAVSKRTNAKVKQVDVELKWVAEGSRRTPYLSKVTVTMAESEAVQTGKERAAQEPKPDVQVEEIEPVDVSIKVDTGAVESDAAGKAAVGVRGRGGCLDEGESRFGAAKYEACWPMAGESVLKSYLSVSPLPGKRRHERI